jgi:2-polyprenyl-3-methyl-5-hydroxy-6-metoxy-1,4-benzoquinol methylase/uncharacterized protein YbaR (Trm112 family)
MKTDWLSFIKCPVLRTDLRLEILEKKNKTYSTGEEEIVWTGILFSEGPFIYPVIQGIPRLIVEAYSDYADFFREHLPEYQEKKKKIESEFGRFIQKVKAKNAHTKKSFSQEWNLYNYETDKTWDLDAAGLLKRFLVETDETRESLKGKWVLDAGCGNGHLNMEMARTGMISVGMDFSLSVERASQLNDQPNAIYIQGDVEFPPFGFESFDLVHSSGVLIATQRTELSLSALTPCVKPGGKVSIWSYQPRDNWMHNLFNFIRNYSSKLPYRFQYYLYFFTLLPVSYVIKKVKGNPQNWREMMIDILDWFSPQFRWEHEVSEVESWMWKRNFRQTKVTDSNMWGFNLVATRETGH